MCAKTLSQTDLPPYWLSPAASRNLFETEVQEVLGIAGEEFLRKLRHGDYADIPDDLEHTKLTYLITLAASVE